jgi:hypothetical protein
VFAGAPGALAADPFAVRVQREIYAVLPFQRGVFFLSDEQRTPLLLYGETSSPTECRQNAAFKMNGDVGTIAVSACPEHVARLRSATAANQRGFEATLDSLQKGIPAPIPDDKLRAIGWYYDRSTVAGGELHYFPILLIGHGVLAVPTVILLTDRQAVVAQASTTHLCGDRIDAHPLCADPRGTLGAIARRVLAAFP